MTQRRVWKSWPTAAKVSKVQPSRAVKTQPTILSARRIPTRNMGVRTMLGRVGDRTATSLRERRPPEQQQVASIGSRCDYCDRACAGLVGPAGIEPATLGLEIRCSIRLSYGPSAKLNAECAEFTEKSFARNTDLLCVLGEICSLTSKRICRDYRGNGQFVSSDSSQEKLDRK